MDSLFALLGSQSCVTGSVADFFIEFLKTNPLFATEELLATVCQQFVDSESPILQSELSALIECVLRRVTVCHDWTALLTRISLILSDR
jgi:hypothetical protein